MALQHARLHSPELGSGQRVGAGRERSELPMALSPPKFGTASDLTCHAGHGGDPTVWLLVILVLLFFLPLFCIDMAGGAICSRTASKSDDKSSKAKLVLTYHPCTSFINPFIHPSVSSFTHSCMHLSIHSLQLAFFNPPTPPRQTKGWRSMNLPTGGQQAPDSAALTLIKITIYDDGPAWAPWACPSTGCAMPGAPAIPAPRLRLRGKRRWSTNLGIHSVKMQRHFASALPTNSYARVSRKSLTHSVDVTVLCWHGSPGHWRNYEASAAPHTLHHNHHNPRSHFGNKRLPCD